MKSEGDYYDPDEDVRPSSPGLVPTQINYKPKETPPPYILTSSSSVSVSPEPDQRRNDRQGTGESVHPPAKKKLKKKRRKKDPNQPDIAREAARRALNSASQSEAEEEIEKDMSGDGDDEDDDGATNEHHRNSAHVSDLKSTAEAALNDVLMDDPAPEKPVVSASLAMHGVVNGTMEKHSLGRDEATQRPTLNALQDVEAPLRSLHPPLPLTVEPAWSESKSDVEDESITTSPALAKWAISPAKANPESTLPAMQKSPPRSTSSHSPDGTQSLPSLQTALSRYADSPTVETPNGLSPFPPTLGQSPTVTRPQYMAGSAGPSPGVYSHPSPASSKDMTIMSPPGYPIPPSYWRSTPKEGSFSTASSTSVPGLTPGTSYHTPKEMTSPESNGTPQVPNGTLPASGPFTPTAFKCTHSGCTAPPFQTQYLLNSHTNVHSSDRPHYCPVKACPRSTGGKGFKRKNEMIRHGLVHDSPGYVCPFCADQQHKYPRPDNLQRHVRVHHPDKQRDDPQLRSVLALRSGEGSRGRRRRTGT